MQRSYNELTLSNALADPMVRAVMAADRVDPQELAAMLTAIASTLRPSPPTAQLACLNCV
jgi:hypothetical protein